MSVQPKSTLPATVIIGGTDVQQILYQGEPVVTFAMVDRLHERPEDTAKRNFSDNRSRFVEGEDYILVRADQRDDFRTFGLEVPNRGLTFLTRRGYLKLTKAMTDDRAWAVQGEMIDRYFAVEAGAPIPSRAAGAREVASVFGSMRMIARLAGLAGNQAILSASQATRKLVGLDPLALIGATHLEAPQNQALLTPSDIGKQLGISGQKVNERLTAAGLQTAQRDRKNRIYYEPTPAGEAAGAVMQDTGKKHGDGTPVRQLKWGSGTVGRLREREVA